MLYNETQYIPSDMRRKNFSMVISKNSSLFTNYQACNRLRANSQNFYRIFDNKLVLNAFWRFLQKVKNQQQEEECHSFSQWFNKLLEKLRFLSARNNISEGRRIIQGAQKKFVPWWRIQWKKTTKLVANFYAQISTYVIKSRAKKFYLTI